MEDYERLGVFYLGKKYDASAGKPTDETVLYESKDLTTHALIVGMTGSGKTGLGITLLEEAAIDGIPALVIDPKGDLGNLLLTFPELKGTDFLPWIDEQEVTKAGISGEQFAQQVADRWKKGLADWRQGPDRIKRLQDAVDMTIYTPGGNAGVPLTVLRSFEVPADAVLKDPDAFREAVSAATASLLGLVGIDADPLRSREHILLSTILDRAWQAGKSLDMPSLVRAIQGPGFDKVGVLDLESFYPAKERVELSTTLNNLLASPGFAAWMAGEPLNIQRLLYTPEGKPRLAILSIAHLSDAERMFFVTILLSEVISWVRSQSGSSSLRALLYMDEVFGYFPPSKNPPSKTPMLTLLKQARAFGLGVVLATQNPVDLDYKGLANCGTWFLGRLQTERDKLRVLDGLEGASTQAGTAFDRASMEKTLSSLGNRVFVMNNVHEDAPLLLQSRWALSYLRGPLSRAQVSALMEPKRTKVGSTLPGSSATASASSSGGASGTTGFGARPIVPPDFEEKFVPLRERLAAGAKLVYRPALMGLGKIHFAQASSDVDHWSDEAVFVTLDGESLDLPWEKAQPVEMDALELETGGEEGAVYAELPAGLVKAKGLASLTSALKDHWYRSERLSLWKCAKPKAASLAKESEGDFRVRLGQLLREQRDAEKEKLRAKYTPKLAAIAEQVRKAEARVEKEKSQANQQIMNTVMSLGSTVLGAVFGRKVVSATSISKATTGLKSASKVWSDRQDVVQAGETVEAYQAKYEALSQEFEAEVKSLEERLDPVNVPLESVTIQPKKADIAVSKVLLVWLPWSLQADGSLTPLASV